MATVESGSWPHSRRPYIWARNGCSCCRPITHSQGTRQAAFSYNVSGFLASVTDPLGLTDSFTYDADGHVLTATLADGRVITFAYDANGNRSSLIPPGKTAHTFAYNTVNFPSKYTPPVVAGAGQRPTGLWLLPAG